MIIYTGPIRIRKPSVAASWCAVLITIFILGACFGMLSAKEPSWQPVKGHIMTRWAKDVSATNVLPEYPRPMIRLGLSAACYTQIADQEIECNGLMTYDREVLKLDAELTAAETIKLYDTPPVVKTVLATSQVVPQTWSYTTEKPGEDWYKPDFDDSGWKTGPAGFGHFNPTHPTLIVSPRTRWTSSDIWIRRSFDLDDTDFVSPHFLIHHDEVAKVYINGKLALNLPYNSNFYTWIPLDNEMLKTLKTGTNSIAVHCNNEHHPQYIDVGIVDILPPNRTAGSGSKPKDGPTK